MTDFGNPRGVSGTTVDLGDSNASCNKSMKQIRLKPFPSILWLNLKMENVVYYSLIENSKARPNLLWSQKIEDISPIAQESFYKIIVYCKILKI